MRSTSDRKCGRLLPSPIALTKARSTTGGPREVSTIESRRSSIGNPSCACSSAGPGRMEGPPLERSTERSPSGLARNPRRSEVSCEAMVPLERMRNRWFRSHLGVEVASLLLVAAAAAV